MYVIQVKTDKNTSYAVWVTNLGKKSLVPTSGTPNHAAQWKTYSGAMNALDKNREFLSTKGKVSVLEVIDDDTQYKRFNVGESVWVARIEDGQITDSHQAKITKRTHTSFWVEKDRFTVAYNQNCGCGDDGLIASSNEDDLKNFRLKNSIERLVKEIKNLEYSHQLEEDLKQIVDKYQ